MDTVRGLVRRGAPGMVLILHGDATHLPLPDASVEAVVCDPPYADQLTMFGKTLATVAAREGASLDENILAWTTRIRRRSGLRDRSEWAISANICG